jgi:tetratricopeptide (TPR) repeat protein
MAETQLAGVLARRGRYDEAFAHYGAALRADPGDAFAYTSYGATLAERGRLEEALAAHRHALAINPDLMEAHANLGNALHQAGRGEEAMHEYEVALRLRPSAEVYNNIGVILLKANRPADAATSFRRALALREDLALLHENLGRALAAGGDRAGARLEYERALQLDAGLPGARAGLAALGAVTP